VKAEKNSVTDGDRVIETSRLILRAMREEDVAELLHVFADPKVMAAFASPPFDRVQMERWVRRNLDHQERYGCGLFSVILRANGLLIGDCGLEFIDLEGHQQAELGYDLRSDYWGQGLATEAARSMRDFAFESLRLPRLISLIRPGNVASRRVAEKIGMRLERGIDRSGRRYWLFAMTGVDPLP
jgi:ribosomal-protein-alanine N-acetyltransferase